MKEVKIKITKELKNRLDELGIYDKWILYTQMNFNKIRSMQSIDGGVRDDLINTLEQKIKLTIENNKPDNLLFLMIGWDETEEGWEYWSKISNII